MSDGGPKPIGSFHRKDIDGLRGVGVLAVLLFHLGVPGAQAGYLGVDIFFVVSGFVITALLTRLIDRGEFSYWNFVKRRARRLFPALGVTLLLSLLATVLLLPQVLHDDVAKSAIAALTGTSNFYFNSTTDYFSPGAIHKPLHHTWSLGVEEQFYLLWPWLVFLALILKQRSRAKFVGLWLIALILAWIGAEWTVRSDQQTAFFLPHARAGEFMLGAACALFPASLRVSRGLRLAVYFLGLGILSGCFVIYNPLLTFPGWRALVPTAAVALIIWANPGKPFGLLLSSRPLVSLGRISYSVYLVHWPLIVFYSHFSLAPLNWSEQLGITALSLGLGALMWRCVEQPFRQATPNEKGLLGKHFGWLAAMLGVSVAFEAFVIATARGGLPANINEENRGLLFYIQKSESRYQEQLLEGSCFTRNSQTLDRSKCLTVEGKKRHLLIVGDSLAASLVFGAEQAASSHVQLHLAAATTCLPLPRPSSESKACKDRTRAVFDEADLTLFDAIILLGAFSTEDQVHQLPSAIERLRQRGARRVVIMGTSIRYRTPLRLVVLRYPDSQLIDLTSRLNLNLEANLLTIDRKMSEATQHANGEFVSLLKQICRVEEGLVCEHFLDTGEPYVRDNVHLSDGAAFKIWNDIERQLGFE